MYAIYVFILKFKEINQTGQKLINLQIKIIP